MSETAQVPCWRSECRNACYYPDVCSERAPATAIGLRHDCPRCGTRHLTSCCHASRHNLCDLCVQEQREQQAREVRSTTGSVGA